MAFSKLWNQDWWGLTGKDPSLQKGCGFLHEVSHSSQTRNDVSFSFPLWTSRNHAEHTHRLVGSEMLKIT